MCISLNTVFKEYIIFECKCTFQKMDYRKTWKCFCGHNNSRNTSICKNCYFGASKFDQERSISIENHPLRSSDLYDWSCKCCSDINSSVITRCKCGRKRENRFEYIDCYDLVKEDERILQQKEPEEKIRSCVICLDKEPDVVFSQCRHLVCCSVCAYMLTNCPICRMNFKFDKSDVLKVFM